MYTTPTNVFPQPGLEWYYEEELFGPEPIWTVAPDMDILRKIVQRELNIPEDAQCNVEFLAEGSLNKVYKVQCSNDKTYVMRVTLPVHPRFKTQCEVATIDFVSQHTDLPIAKVLKHDASFNNELGFEWMIQEYVPGESLEKAWQKTSMEQKEVLVRKIVAYLARLFENRFDRIGGLYQTNPSTLPPPLEWNPAMMPLLAIQAADPSYHLGEVISLQLFISDHLSHSGSRGPYASSRSWLAARIQLYIEDALKVMTDTTLNADDYDRKAASAIMNIGMRLLMLLPKVFPSPEDEDMDSFIIHNHDLDIQNILVNTDGDLTGVIDWENIHTSPLWYACQLPKFLCGQTLHDRPVEADFMIQDDDDENKLVLDDMYWYRLRQFDQTQLRKVFFEEMERACPEWVRVFEESTEQADFELAVQNIDNELCCGMILTWIEGMMEDEEPTSLCDVFRR
jgi:Ser/Thr protein kinase RdoA (MazF antagonist)